jgi:hypothetical protein
MTGMACAALNAFVLLSTLAWRDGGGVAVAKTVKNDIDSIDSWHYLTRFAFMPVPEHKVDMADQNQKYGLFEFEVWYPSGTRPVLGLYFNGFKNWRKIYGSYEGDCVRKVQEAATSGKDNANQIQKIALYEDSSSEHFITDRMSNSKGMTRTRGRAFFDTRKATWFFITAYSCDIQCGESYPESFCDAPMQIEYKFWMTNAKGNQEDWSKREFSADEIGMFELYISAGCISFVFAIQAFRVSHALNRRKKCAGRFPGAIEDRDPISHVPTALSFHRSRTQIPPHSSIARLVDQPHSPRPRRNLDPLHRVRI